MKYNYSNYQIDINIIIRLLLHYLQFSVHIYLPAIPRKMNQTSFQQKQPVIQQS